MNLRHGPPPPHPTPSALSRVLHRETVRLLVLIAVAAGTTLLTRAIAESSRAWQRRDAAQWFERGRSRLEEGDAEGAAAAFRRAAIQRRGEIPYVLALAAALVQAGSLDAAERTLVAAREAHPEDPDINVALAQAAGTREDVSTAIHYYHNALYAPWDDAEGRRQVRLSLIRFLLDHGRTHQAIAELIAAATDVPASAQAHIEIGQLFVRAGDSNRALDQFNRALDLDAQHHVALAGAGRASFALGDYQSARRYLKQVPTVEATTLSAVANFVITRDPLASRISAAERRRRIAANLARATERVNQCFTTAAPDTVPALTSEIAALKVGRRAVARDDDTLEAAVNLIYRIEEQADARCGGSTPLDRALLLIAERHGLNHP